MLRVGSNFSGIGAYEAGLRNLEIEHEMQFFSEIDKYASSIDISKIDHKLIKVFIKEVLQ